MVGWAMGLKFNKSFNDRGEKPEFMYKPNPLVKHSYQIFRFKEDKKEYEPVGEYVVVNVKEDIEITEKKMVNLVRILNGKKDLMQLGNLTKTRILYTIVPRASETDPTRIIFREYDGKGVSRENAVLTLEKGVLDESN
jgi:hypothetical protein